MTDNIELIHDLRHGYPSELRLKAADALEAAQAEIVRLKAALTQAHDALAFAYNDCESDYVRDEKIDPAMDAIQRELT